MVSYTTTVILLGGNHTSTPLLFTQVLAELAAIGRNLKMSSRYRTPAWGFDSPHPFLNQAVQLETALSAPELMEALLNLETRMGRVRNTEGYADRLIDLDILYYGDQVQADKKLIIPHPRLAIRKFALVPLAEICPHWVHPGTGQSLQALLEACPDQTAPEKIA